MSIEVNVKISDENQDVAVVNVKGRLDAQPSDKLEGKLLSLIEQGKVNIVLNLEEVSYLGSSGIRIFLGIINNLRKRGGRMKLANMPVTGVKILKVMEIIDRFEIYESVSQAVNSF